MSRSTNPTMTPLGLKYHITAVEYRAYLNHLQKRGSPLARPDRAELVLRWLTVLVPVGLFAFLALAQPPGPLRNAGLAGGLMVVALLGCLLGYSRLMARRYQPEPAGQMLGKRSLKFDDNGLRCVSEHGMSQQRWHHLRAWEATDTAYYIWLDRVVAHIIPRRVLDNAQEVQLQHWLNSRLGAAPKLVPPPTQASEAPLADETAATRATNASAQTEATFSHNLLTGLHALIWPVTRLRRDDVHLWQPAAHVGHLLLFSAAALAIVAFAQYVAVPGTAALSPWGLMSASQLIVAGLVLLCLCSLAVRRADRLGALLTLIAAGAVWGVVGWSLWRWLTGLDVVQPYAAWCSSLLFLMLWSTYVTWALLTRGLALTPLRALLLAVFAIAAMTLLWREINPMPLWYAKQPEAQRDYPELSVEQVYYRQGSLLNQALHALPRERPDQTDLYFVGFGNDASIGVFANEVRRAETLFGEQFGSSGRSLLLLNDYDSTEDIPLANAPNLGAALRDIAAKMDIQQDMLIMYLTSHGTEQASLSAQFWPLQPEDLSAEDLKSALDEAGIRWRILIIAGCYTGSFIPVLADEYSLIMTAAASDRVSFGCDAKREFTYFGDALLNHGLKDNPDLLDAWEITRSKIAEWEAAQGYTPSDPQLHAGQAILAKLGELRTEPDKKEGRESDTDVPAPMEN